MGIIDIHPVKIKNFTFEQLTMKRPFYISKRMCFMSNLNVDSL